MLSHLFNRIEKSNVVKMKGSNKGLIRKSLLCEGSWINSRHVVGRVPDQEIAVSYVPFSSDLGGDLAAPVPVNLGVEASLGASA